MYLSHIKKNIALIKSISSILVLYVFFTIVTTVVLADSALVATSVTVGNSSPAFVGNAAEIPASTGTSPINVGSTISIGATATDANGESYYLAVCKTASVTAVNGGAPTCPGGSFCVSSATTSGVGTTCSYGVIGADAETQNWYAYVCDGNASSAACSSVNSGSGDSASPFYVNHAPSLTAVGVTSPVNVGQTVSWTTTASDGDTTPSQDTIKLVVCKTTGVSAGACDGGASDTWCASSLVASNPTCSIGISAPMVDQSYNAYTYVFDTHNFGASGANQGIGASFVVNNAAPIVSSVNVNSGSAISLGEGQTTPVSLTATVTDNNGCSDLSTVVASLYRSAVAFASCDEAGNANNNNCYPVIACSTSNCTTGVSADYTCTAYLKSYADPTDTNSQYDGQKWIDTFLATDNNSVGTTGSVTPGVTLNSLSAFDVTGTIGYGSLSVGQKTDPLDKITTITNTGNTGLDQDLSGEDMNNGVGGTIAVSYQRYALIASTAYSSGTTLTTSAVTSLVHVAKTTSDTGATKPTYWGLEIPSGTTSGSYTGQNTVESRVSNSSFW